MKSLTLILALFGLMVAGAATAQTCSPGGSYASYCGSDSICFGLPWCTCDDCCRTHYDQQWDACQSCGSDAARQSCLTQAGRNSADCWGVCDRQVACSPADPYCGFSPTKPPSGS